MFFYNISHFRLTTMLLVLTFLVFDCLVGGESLDSKSRNRRSGNEKQNEIDKLKEANHRHKRSETLVDSNTILVTYGFIKAAVKQPGWAAYIGCFSTSDQWSAETAHLVPARLRNAGTHVRACVEDCWQQRQRFAIIGRGGNCLCGGFLKMMTKDKPSLCKAPCVSNNTFACGGTTALDVYYTGYIEEPAFDVFAYDEVKKVYQGCYEDSKSSTLCPFSFSTTRLNVQMCMEYCSQNFFKYAALSSPQKCCCTASVKEAYPTKPGLCNLLCDTGRGKHESCGGDKGFLAVYATGAAEMKDFKVAPPTDVWIKPHLKDAEIRRMPVKHPKTHPEEKATAKPKVKKPP